MNRYIVNMIFLELKIVYSGRYARNICKPCNICKLKVLSSDFFENLVPFFTHKILVLFMPPTKLTMHAIQLKL